MKKEIFSCDVCKIEGIVNKKQIQVIFTTEQTEGRSVHPYLSLETIDICPGCEHSICNGNSLYGSGAQGYNQYWFKDSEKVHAKNFAEWLLSQNLLICEISTKLNVFKSCKIGGPAYTLETLYDTFINNLKLK